MKKLLFVMLFSVMAFAQVGDKSTYERIFDLSAQSKNIVNWKTQGLIDDKKADSLLVVYETEILSMLGQQEVVSVDTEKIKAELESLLNEAPTYCLKAKLTVFKKRLTDIIALF